MPGWRGFSTAEAHGWLPRHFQALLGRCPGPAAEPESRAQSRSWLGGCAFNQHVICAKQGVSGKLDDSPHSFDLIPSSFDWGK